MGKPNLKKSMHSESNFNPLVLKYLPFTHHVLFLDETIYMDSQEPIIFVRIFIILIISLMSE